MQGDQRPFWILVSILNMMSFCVPAGTLTFVPGEESRRLAYELYGISSLNLLGPWILLVGIPIIFLTYIVISRESIEGLNKGLAVSLIALGGTFISLLNFRPFPHLMVLGCGTFYGVMIGLITVCHDHDFDLKADDDTVSETARVERVKLEYETWFRGLIVMVAAVGAVSGTLVFTSYNYMRMLSPHGEVTIDVLRATLDHVTAHNISAFYFGILLVVLATIMLRKITELSNQLHKIPSR